MTRKPVLNINPSRIAARIDHLSAITDPSLPAYTRRAFTDTYTAGRRWLEEQFNHAGLAVHLDESANLIGRREGVRADAPALALGSHTDTVMAGGRFDGVAGVVAALEVAEVLYEQGHQLQHPLEVIDFLSEEPSDYGASCVGSRGMAGTLTEAMLNASNSEGETLRSAIRRMGGVPERLTRPLRGKNDMAAFIELHIEQGPSLEREGCAVGIISGIVGIERYQLRILGEASHSGTTPMRHRKDALVGAAWIVREVSRRARDDAQQGLVATIGKVEVKPNGANVVPGEVRLTLEVRALQDDHIGAFFDAVVRESRAQLGREGLGLEVSQLSAAPATSCASGIQDALREAAARRGHAVMVLQSGAGHDAMQISTICPVGMLFVPSVGGRSHCPEEYTSPHDIAAGAEVMLDAVMSLDLHWLGA